MWCGAIVSMYVLEKLMNERDELQKEVTALKRDLEITREERNRARLKEEWKWRSVVDELRKELAEAAKMLSEARDGYVINELPVFAQQRERVHQTNLIIKIDTFLARQQPPAAVDTQEVTP